tara:strand:- start:1531 stop:2076 length:546 start_codon:yes stop_codon:yes gene_type:complete
MEIIKNFKEIQIAKKLFLALIGTILLAISAKISIPFWPVPMTMQTFVVMFIGIIFGWKLGLFTVTLYLFEGIIGLPVFAGTPEKGVGIAYFIGPTMGYLVGFLAAVFFSGYLTFTKNLFTNFFKLLFSVSFIYIFGMIWLGTLLGWEKPIFELGAKPFLLAELFKIILLTLLITKFQKVKI